MRSLYVIRRAARPFPVVALALAATTSSAAAQTVSIRPRYEANAEHVYRTTMNSSINGGFISQTQTMTSVTRQRVVSVAEDGSAMIRMTTESLKMTMDGPMGVMEYDSQTGTMPTGPMAAVASALASEVGKSRDMEFTKDGAMRSLDGVSAFGSSEELLMFPTQPVAVGAEWDREANVTLPSSMGVAGTMKASSHFRLKEVVAREGRRIAVIEIATKGVLERDPSSPGADLIGSSLPIESTGEIHFDLERGLTVRTVQRQVADITLMGESMRTISETVSDLIP